MTDEPSSAKGETSPRSFSEVSVPDTGGKRKADPVPVERPANLDPRAAAKDLPKELGGYDGPEPTRFGDWEHKGRCTDF